MDWGERLATGLPELDAYHRDLIEKINEALAACEQKRDRESVSSALDKLGALVIKYFREEERILRANNYPDYWHHHSMHDVFVEKYQEMLGRFELEGPCVQVESALHHDLVEWLLRHMADTDKQWARHITSRSDIVPV